jgi:hypothetical protein
MLNSYLTDTALLLNDPSNQFYSTTTLTTLINRARRWMSVLSLQPRVLVTTVSTVKNQETLALTLANSAVAASPGCASPYGTIGIAVQQGNYFIALGRKDFPSFQADDRILNQTLKNYPDRFATYNRGQLQVVYMFPVPADVYSVQWDIACTPINLVADTDVEAIPLPWTEIVPFQAARLAAITQQRWADAEGFRGEVESMMNEATAAEMPFMRGDWYPASR